MAREATRSGLNVSGGEPPLGGLRVVAVEQAVAAPICTRHLSELGAEVIKVERPDVGDFARSYDSSVGGVSTHFTWLNHGKKSVAIDFASADGKQLLAGLIASSDILVCNLSAGAADRHFPDVWLEELNPSLVRCFISGYGSVGRYKNRKAYDLIVQGEGGVTLNTGTPHEPAKPGVSLADLGAGVYAVASIVAALYARQASGKGARIEIAMFDVVAEWMMPLLLAHDNGGSVPTPAGARHASICPYGPFCTGDGRHINIAVHTDAQWRSLCSTVLESDEIGRDPRYASNERRLRYRSEVDQAVSAKTKTLDSTELVSRLEAADIPWGYLNDIPEVLSHPALVDRDRWVPVELPTGEGARVLKPPFWSGNRVAHNDPRRIPEIGEDTQDVLRSLGIGSERIEQLIRDHVVGAPRKDSDGPPTRAAVQ